MAPPVDIPTMELADVGGIELEFEIHDHGSGEPVVFIHTVRDEWYAVLAEPTLAERYRLVHYHRRGFGNSSTDGVPLSIAEHASDCRAVMSHLMGPRAAVPSRILLLCGTGVRWTHVTTVRRPRGSPGGRRPPSCPPPASRRRP